MNFLLKTIPNDIKSELRKMIISYSFPGASLQNYLRGYIPPLYYFEINGESLEIDITGNQGNFSSNGTSNKSGVIFGHSISLDLNDSNSEIEEEIYRFIGREVVVLLYTNTELYQIGNFVQPLILTADDDSESISFRIKGETYFAAIRHNIR